MARFASSHGIRRSTFNAALVVILGAAPAVAPTMAVAQNRLHGATTVHEIDAHIAEAAHRFGIPAAWINAVIEVESAGDPRAVSRAGAMGLMQIMPDTWADLRLAHGVGDDPFDPRENILAGTAYLRAMYDRFGSPGFIAAYNAGPARYDDYLTSRRPLPAETRNYLAILAPIIGAQQDARLADELPLRPQDWREAPLFSTSPFTRPNPGEINPQSGDHDVPHGMFVPRDIGTAMSTEFALGRRLACSVGELCLNGPMQGITPEVSQDKRPGTLARHAVVFGVDLPCQLRANRANLSGKHLIANNFRGAGALCKGSAP